ncbi:sulfurtransferase [Thiomicrospira microaerophila]|uniref:sulfurtransferase n=1 Tax=Thiomicrospira microaerophila TaxID=406020 RepID=UPI00200FE230|nr:rhodanese-like domain-containing protein [Thiomicrospira microaerophila]UQB41851.1 sulfurtransferase [Thiomicrospira microaerophila]
MNRVKPGLLISVLLVFMLSIALVSTSFASAVSSRIVNLVWLQQYIDDPDVRIIDLRNPDAYLAGHIKNSVNIYYMELFDQELRMPTLDEMRSLLGQAGIDDSIRVVAIDDGSFIWSARFVWLLETLGHERVHMLDVAYGNWQGQPIPISTRPLIPETRQFVTQINTEILQTKLGTLVAIGKAPILDGRAEAHYLGVESTARRFGHIPTAQHSPCTQNIKQTDAGNQLYPLDDLTGLYIHLPKDQTITLYCDGGAEAALNYVVMRELGYKVTVYDGSWVEWGNDPILPVDNPSQP